MVVVAIRDFCLQDSFRRRAMVFLIKQVKLSCTVYSSQFTADSSEDLYDCLRVVLGMRSLVDDSVVQHRVL
jgi:hypothetical protein